MQVTSGPLHTPIDFAIANGRVYQVAHTWSFQIASLADVAKEVEAWGYTIQALRNSGGEVVEADGTTEIAADVNVAVLYAEPTADAGREVFAEAERVFSDVNARYRPLAGRTQPRGRRCPPTGCRGRAGVGTPPPAGSGRRADPAQRGPVEYFPWTYRRWSGSAEIQCGPATGNRVNRVACRYRTPWWSRRHSLRAFVYIGGTIRHTHWMNVSRRCRFGECLVTRIRSTIGYSFSIARARNGVSVPYVSANR